ncbi:MAG: cytochrome b, partial [Rhodobacterales bacterium]
MPKGYSSTQIALHWVIALLIALQFLFNEPMAEAFESAMEGELQPFSWAVWAHIAGGITILALALWRVALRRSRGAPPPRTAARSTAPHAPRRQAPRRRTTPPARPPATAGSAHKAPSESALR